MTRSLFLNGTSLFASLLLLSAGATTAAAGIDCTQELRPSTGTPPVDRQHIFCGEVKAGAGRGYHSRPNGDNATSFGAISNRPDPENDTRTAPTPRAGIYWLYHFNISVNGMSGEKRYSTMFPDRCSEGNVVAAIENAANNRSSSRGKLIGPSGDRCMDDDGNPFDIVIYFDPDEPDRVHSAHPNFDPPKEGN